MQKLEQTDDQVLNRHAIHMSWSCIISESRGSNRAETPMHETYLAALSSRHGSAVYGTWHALSNKAYEAKCILQKRQTNPGNAPRQSRGAPLGARASSAP